MTRRQSAVLALAAVAALPTIARAQAPEAVGPSGAGGPTPICTDRPAKGNAPCTVDAGHLQYETDLFSGSFQRLNGTTTDVYLATNPTLKYGLSSSVDVEVNIAPYEVVRMHDKSGATRTLGGVGDLYLRAKWNAFNTADGAWGFAALPYLKVPTARDGLGNGAVEGGLLAPVSWKVSDKVSLTTVPEVDTVEDQDGRGRHLSSTQLVTLAYSLPRDVTVYGELWGNWNHDPAGLVRQYSADVAASWLLTPRLQVDGGLNFGLNRQTPGVQAYFGVSQKF